jgi:spore germination protein GerM
VLVYFVAGNRLQPVVRDLTEPATVAKAIIALLAGPDEGEAVSGIRSAISPAASILPSRHDPATVIVDLSVDFVQGTTTSEQVLGLAQIVFTATEIQGVTGVRFTLEGASIEVPTPSGAVTAQPVGRDAFDDLKPLPPDARQPN